MISVVTWCWGWFSMDHVARMQSMLRRHLSLPHRMFCVTDRPAEVPDGVTAVPLPQGVPHGEFRNTRILWQYSREAAEVLGPRILSLNLDLVMTDSLDPLFDRPEPFVIYRSESRKARGFAYNTSIVLFDGGSRADIWERYCADPDGMYAAAEADGWGRGNSDQSIVCYVIHPDGVPTWDASDGIVSYRETRVPRLPKGTRIVSLHGHADPSLPEVQKHSPWILEHWR